MENLNFTFTHDRVKVNDNTSRSNEMPTLIWLQKGQESALCFSQCVKRNSSEKKVPYITQTDPLPPQTQLFRVFSLFENT